MNRSPTNPRSRPGGQGGPLTPYLQAIRAHRVVFVLVVLATVAAAAVWTASSKSEYSATAQVLVNPLPQDNQTFLGFDLLRESGDPTRTVQTAAALIETRDAADRAAKVVGGNRDGEELLNSISVQPAGESNILNVTATADSPEEAARTANAFVAAALKTRTNRLQDQVQAELERLEASGSNTPETEARINTLKAIEGRGDPTLTLAQKATPSDEAIGASTKIVIALAILAGLALATGTVIVLELTARRIRDEHEAQDLYPLPVLARVPVLSRANRRAQDAGNWNLPPRIREPFRSVFAQVQREQDHRVVLFTSGSTGDGKTTSAISMAVTMALSGQSTVLLDGDFRKPEVANAMRVTPRPLPVADFRDRIAINDALVEVPRVPNLGVLSPRGADQPDDTSIESFTEHLPDLLRELATMARFVVVDTAPLGEVSDALLITPAVDDIVIVVYPGRTNRANFEVMCGLLERTGDQPAGLLVIGDHSKATTGYYGYGMEQRMRPRPPAPADPRA